MNWAILILALSGMLGLFLLIKLIIKGANDLNKKK